MSPIVTLFVILAFAILVSVLTWLAGWDRGYRAGWQDGRSAEHWKNESDKAYVKYLHKRRHGKSSQRVGS